MYTRRRVLAALTAGVAGCGVPRAGPGPSTTPTAGDHWYPHVQPTRNRRLAGAAPLHDATPVTIPVGNPMWLVALPATGGSDWVVVTDDGMATRWRVRDGDAQRQEQFDSFDGVPVVRSTDDGVSLVRPPDDVSRQTQPMFTPDGRTRLVLASDGDLLVTSDGSTDRVDVDGLHDGRVARLGPDRYALLGEWTKRYTHAALGNSIEGSTIVVVDADGTVQSEWEVGPPAVVEELGPLVADLDGDGQPELLVPVADNEDGARMAAYTPTGERLGTGPIEGSGWRHPLAVAPFGPDGQPELAVVRKPHVQHVLEFYRLDDGLSRVTTLTGFRSHTLGSRILDGGVAVDADDDGTVELLLPTTDRQDLAAVSRSSAGASVDWRLSLDRTLTTNVTGVAHDEAVAVGAGTESGVRVWQA